MDVIEASLTAVTLTATVLFFQKTEIHPLTGLCQHKLQSGILFPAKLGKNVLPSLCLHPETEITIPLKPQLHTWSSKISQDDTGLQLLLLSA